jgi:D-threo-aldose 1-dehydrogenase
MHTTEVARGVTLSSLGIGGSQFGNLGRVATDEQCATVVERAWRGGVRYIDTAPHYGLGLSERRFGELLRHYPREDYTVSTKAGRLLVPTAGRVDDGFVAPAAHRRQFDFTRDGILRSIEGSLERLRTDYLDIAYLHDPDDHWEAASTTGIGTLIELRDQGVVRAVGAGMNQSGMLADFVDHCDVNVVMLAGRFTLRTGDWARPLPVRRDPRCSPGGDLRCRARSSRSTLVRSPGLGAPTRLISRRRSHHRTHNHPNHQHRRSHP